MNIGGSLATLIENCKKNIPEENILRLLAEVLLGLKQLHDNGIIHTNLNPYNILLDENGHAKIANYICAGIIEDGKRKVEVTYMSPEQLKNEIVRISTDAWSLGCILHELCCLKVILN
jgi:serine/threonine protein kinase